jgi:hypothetical protein
MATTTADPPLPVGRVWFAILAPPAAWAVQQWAIWFLDSYACTQSRVWSLSRGAAHAAEIFVSVIALLVALAALAVAIRAWRESQDPGVAQVHGRARPDFMAATALFVSASFTLGVFWAGWPPLILRACEPFR